MRLNGSSNRRPGSLAAQWCSLVCIRRTRRSASYGSGHGSPVITSASVPCSSIACVNPLDPSPCSRLPDPGLLRVLRPTRGRKRTTRRPSPDQQVANRERSPPLSSWRLMALEVVVPDVEDVHGRIRPAAGSATLTANAWRSRRRQILTRSHAYQMSPAVNRLPAASMTIDHSRRSPDISDLLPQMTVATTATTNSATPTTVLAR